MKHPPFRVLVVCMANVCRSPMAEAVIRAMAASHSGLSVQVDSAGTRVARPGTRPDPRAGVALQRRGYPVRKGRSRALTGQDFERFDLLLAMDRVNLADMLELGAPHHHAKVRLLLDYAPGVAAAEVPDPYFGSAAGFEHVLDLCEAGAKGLLGSLCKPTAPGSPLHDRP